jgi:hypothetical protein
MSDRTLLDVAVKQIEFARGYLNSLLEDLTEDDWFRQPPTGVSHIAWQVGHLAVAQYGLGLFRLRGRQPIDTELMPSTFRKKFSKGTTPAPGPDNNPSPVEIRGIFDSVYQQVLKELPEYADADLDTPVDPPHAVFDTKMGAIYFCSQHEMLHAGQIGLLRRLIGKQPVR